MTKIVWFKDTLPGGCSEECVRGAKQTFLMTKTSLHTYHKPLSVGEADCYGEWPGRLVCRLRLARPQRGEGVGGRLTSTEGPAADS